jgi:hypothetical protein
MRNHPLLGAKMAVKPKIHNPDELKTLFEALNTAPSYLSKRFILMHMLGWSEETLKLNMQLVEEEANMKKLGQRGGY